MAAMSLSAVSEGCAGGCEAEEVVGGGGGGGGSGCWEGGSETGGRPVLASGRDKREKKWQVMKLHRQHHELNTQE